MSLAEDRHTQAREVCKHWLLLKEGALRSGTITDEEREEGIVSRLIELCTPEIVQALKDDSVGRVFCDIWLVVDRARWKVTWLGNVSILKSGVSKALRAKLNNRKADIVALIRISVAEELANRRDERIEELMSRKARDILPELLDRVDRNQRDNAAVIVDHLTGAQRSDLKVLLHDQFNDGAVINIRMDQEPEEPRMWLLWHLHHSEFALPENLRKMGGIPRDLIAIRRGAVRKNKRGDFVMPLGPMYAKVFEAHEREMNKMRMRPKNPGIKKIAEGLHVDHSTAARWLKEDIPVKLEPDGNGGVHYALDLTTIQRCIETIAGKKRGPKRKGS